MLWHGAAGALLLTTISTPLVCSTVVTVKSYPNICSTAHSSRSHHDRAPQSTTGTYSIPGTEEILHHGSPFMLQVTPFIPGRRAQNERRAASQPTWLMSTGDITTDETMAATYRIDDGKLMSVEPPGHISTGRGVQAQTFAVLPELLQIHSTFFIRHDGELQWKNRRFADGMAHLYQTTSNSIRSPYVIARFHGAIDRSWTRVRAIALPVGYATRKKSSYEMPNMQMSSQLTYSTIPVSQNGLCGPRSGFTCAGSSFGQCCSSNGHCGHGSAFCSVGCQSSHGYCWGASRNSSLLTSSTQAQAARASHGAFRHTMANAKSTSQWYSNSSASSMRLSTPTMSSTMRYSTEFSNNYSSETSPTSIVTSTAADSITRPPPDAFIAGLTPSNVASSTANSSLSSAVILPVTTSSLIATTGSTANSIPTGPLVESPDSSASTALSNTTWSNDPTPSTSSSTMSSLASATKASITMNSLSYTSTPSSAMVLAVSSTNSDSSSTATLLPSIEVRTSSTLTDSAAPSSTALTSNAERRMSPLSSRMTASVVITLPSSSRLLDSFVSFAATTSLSNSTFARNIAADTSATLPTSSLSTLSSTSRSYLATATTTSTTTTSTATTAASRSLSSSSSLLSSPSTGSTSSSVVSSLSTSSSTWATTTTSSSTSSSNATSTTSSAIAATTTMTSMTTTTTSSTSSSPSPSLTSISSSSTLSSSTTTYPSSYLILPNPTACSYGDPPKTNEDDSYCEIDLPFPMRMFAQSDIKTYAHINGFISLSQGSPQYQPAAFPIKYLPNNTVAPFFDDLYLSGNSLPPQGIFYRLNPEQTAVTYEFYMGRREQPAALFHFLVDYDSRVPGVFVFTYISTGGPTDNGSTCAVGIQGVNPAGNEVGFTYGYSSGSISPGLVVTCNTISNTCVTTVAGSGRRR